MTESRGAELDVGTLSAPVQGQKRQVRSKRVKVLVRVRPLSMGKSSEGFETKVVETGTALDLAVALNSDRPTVTADPAHAYIEAQDHSVPFSKRLAFTFDAVLDERAGEQEVHNTAVAPLVQNVMQGGIHASLLLYGASGSGKSHTVAGAIRTAVLQMFATAHERQESLSYRFSVAFLGESVRSALHRRGGLLTCCFRVA